MPEVYDLFRAVETKKRDILKTRRIEDLGVSRLGPHLVMMRKGSVPRYITLTPYQQFCWRTLGGIVKLKAKPNPTLERALIQAHMKLRPEEYIAVVWMNTIIAGVVGAVLAISFGLILFNIFGLIFGLMLVALPPVIAYFLTLNAPSSKAKARAKDIDSHLYSALTFIAAMSSANVNVDVIFKELSRQEIYGEIREEAEWITRDTEILGKDILTAIRLGAERTPSQRFRDFLQGVITTSTSGGQLKPYFISKAEQAERENRLALRSTMETLGMLAESFVTVGVAFPLFLVIIMAIMAIVSKTATFILNMLYVIVFGMIPGVQVAFIVVLSAIGGKEVG
ncbi:MAG: type II secretion protein F [Thermoplasmata archaeon]|nr:MAG: type II secretion protein F [Thermoplasmata archaeon]